MNCLLHARLFLEVLEVPPLFSYSLGTEPAPLPLGINLTPFLLLAIHDQKLLQGQSSIRKRHQENGILERFLCLLEVVSRYPQRKSDPSFYHEAGVSI